jgi:hypothetical protein
MTRRQVVRLWVPQQHGAWAMLVVPFLGGMILGGASWWQLPLLPAWLLSFAAAHHGQQFLRLRRASRRPGAANRHLAPLGWLGGIAAVLAGVLAAAHPWLLLAAAAMAPFVAINTIYAARNRERALLNDFVALIPACGMLPIVARLATGRLEAVAWAGFAACLLYFAGTVLVVKTMIRERGSRGYRIASGAYHAGALVAAGALSWWLAAPFALYLARALILPTRRMRPAAIGAVEIVNSAILLAAMVLMR